MKALTTAMLGAERLATSETDGKGVAVNVAQALIDGGIVTIVNDAGTILHANENFCQLLGYTAHELSGQSRTIIRSPETPNSVYTEMWTTISSGQPWQGEMCVRHAKGADIWLHTSVTPIYDADGTHRLYVCLHTDITERRQAQKQLAQAQIIQAQMLRMGTEWYWETDENHVITHVSDGFARTGIPLTKMIGRPRWHYASQEDTDAWQAHKEVMEQHKPFREFEYKLYPKEGAPPIWLSSSGDPLFDETGRFCGYRGVGWETTVERMRKEAIWRLANLDPLTGLPNRQLFTETLRNRTSEHRQAQIALILIDIDDFKSTNDSRGNQAGDELLTALANHLSHHIEKDDFLSRISGDEFAIIRTGFTSAEALGASLGRLVQSMHDGGTTGEISRHTISVGAALHPQDAGASDELLKNAQIALHHAKQRGGNQYRLYSTEHFQKFIQKSRTMQEVHKALDRDEMMLYYQPIVDCNAGRAVGLEALLRWNCPQRGVLGPAHFWPVFSNSALAARIGRIVLKTAIAQAAQWKRMGVPFGKVSINVTSADFAASDLVLTISDLMQSNGIAPSELCIEVTEGMFLGDTADKVIGDLRAINKMGIEIAFDDFGTGYASLMHLKLPIDRLKIDRSFVAQIESDRANRAIVKAVAQLGRDLGKAVTVEGVETCTQSDLLNAMGCHEQQGYLYSQPLPPDRVPDYIAADGSRGETVHDVLAK